VAVVEGLRRAADVPAQLKWPNDVLVDGLKVCGILAERVETPTGRPAWWGWASTSGWLKTSCRCRPPRRSRCSPRPGSPARGPPSRNQLIAPTLAAFELIFQRWEVLDDDSLFAASYLQRCETIGRRSGCSWPVT
jgi:BirA family biotin operon repressor/biotin-[acetyl-CoA-carboxylase] ligase